MFNDKHNVEKKGILTLLVLLVFILHLTAALKWIGLFKERTIYSNDTEVCKRIRGDYNLTRQQTKLCKKYITSVPYIQDAARLSVYACQNLFYQQRWNCSSIVHLPSIRPDLATDTKERGFVNALSAAALTYSVSRGCALYTISGCTCGPHPEEPPYGNFKWGGCGDNINWGAQFSRDFQDFKEKKRIKSLKRKTNSTHKYRKIGIRGRDASNIDVPDPNFMLWKHIRRHNAEVGRRIVADSLVTHCICHGVSGSCSIKTCWKGLPLKFYEIAEKVKSAYDSSVHVLPHMTGKQLTNRYDGLTKLLYANKSPNFCDYDMKRGSYGTKGRECNASAGIQENCDNMCCGRGYKSEILEVAEKCNCQYQWCCNVTCDTCYKIRNVTICN